MPKPEAERKIGQKVEVHIITVGVHDRTWVDYPSGNGIFTLDRTQGYGDLLTVASYLLHPEDQGNRETMGEVLSDWKTSPSPSRDRLPTQVAGDAEGTARVRFIQCWSETVRPGYQLSVETFRGQTPVRMIFQAA